VTTIRAFLSVNLGIEVLRAITAAQREARARCAAAGWNLTWVPPPNVHVVLRYLGEISSALSRPVLTALRPHVEPLAPFSLKAVGLRPIAAEADPGHAARIVVSVVDETGALARLQTSISTPLEELGFRPQAPGDLSEIVVARVTAAGGAPLEELIGTAAGLDFGSSLVAELLLYQSSAHAPKGEYARLGYVPLLGHSAGSVGSARHAEPARDAANGLSVPAGHFHTHAHAHALDDLEPEAMPPECAESGYEEVQIVVLDEPDDEDQLLDDEEPEDDEADDDPGSPEPP
jgi:2'-5' RNA ligase